jgi:hypothetical protein
VVVVVVVVVVVEQTEEVLVAAEKTRAKNIFPMNSTSFKRLSAYNLNCVTSL